MRWNGRGVRAPEYAGLPSMKENFDSIFNYATLPFYLASLEKEYGSPDYSYLDHLQEEFEKAGITTKGHPLWWAHTAGMPAWTRDLKWEDGSIRREICRVVTRSVKRYKGRIHYYDAINENHDWCNAYNLTQDQQTLMTKACCDAMHEVDPEVHAVVNTCFMFGENAADGRTQWWALLGAHLVPYSAIERLEELGVQYEAIACSSTIRPATCWPSIKCTTAFPDFRAASTSPNWACRPLKRKSVPTPPRRRLLPQIYVLGPVA
jgi:hypothetical protein